MRPLRLLLALLGISLLAIPLLGPVIGIGSRGFGRADLLLTLAACALLTAAALGRRTGAAYRTFAVVALNTVLLVSLLELAAMVALRVFPERRVLDEARQRYYASQPWAAQLWREYDEVDRRRHYQPYFVWQRDPFRGLTTNIGADGTRRTPGAQCGARPFRVFAFGGSTMWGLGSPDSATIAAYLQAALATRSRTPVCVVNYGDLGFVSSQSVTRLMGELQAGRVPDLVIFYDGANEVHAAYLAGRAGVHFAVDEIAARVEGRAARGPGVLRSSKLFALARRITPARRQAAPRSAAPASAGDTLAASVARVYFANARMVRALGREYGFRVLFFWQPVIWEGRKRLTPDEVRLRAEPDSGLARLFAAAYPRVERSAAREDVHLLTDAFDDEPSLVWIDFNHVTPEGNAIIARRIAEVIGATSP